MDYYFYILITWVLMLLIIRIIFSELEGRMARKNYNIRWMLTFKQPFSYQRSRNIFMMCVLCYIVSSDQIFLSTIWMFELVGFIAAGIVTDGIAQLLSYYYINIRFRKLIGNAQALRMEIQNALTKDDDTEIQYSDAPLSLEEIMQKYENEEDHMAIISMDGGQFVESIRKLPTITYVVESLVDKATKRLENKGVKVTTYAARNRLPFKDEKMDVVVNKLTNYDKFEAFRVLKPGGYLIVDQLGSDNYKEIASMFIPFKMRGRWDKENCSRTLHDIGMEVIDAYEEEGYMRFNSLSSVLTFMRDFSPERVENYDKYLNFYARIVEEIKEKQYFDLTTHRFIVVAQKK